MINIISAILFSFSANIDNIAIGMAYGVKKVHIPILKNIIISLITTLITIISMELGTIIFLFLNERTANLIGSIGLVIIGSFGIIKYIYNKIFDNNEKKITNDITKLNFKEMMLIIVSLSLNNIAAGIVASATGTDIIITLISTFIFSFLFLRIGNTIGKNIINKFFSKYSDIIGSLILIIIGIIQIIY